MKNNSINQLAIDYFLEKGKAKKFGILLKAEKLLNQYQFSSYSRFKKQSKELRKITIRSFSIYLLLKTPEKIYVHLQLPAVVWRVLRIVAKRP